MEAALGTLFRHYNFDGVGIHAVERLLLLAVEGEDIISYSTELPAEVRSAIPRLMEEIFEELDEAEAKLSPEFTFTPVSRGGHTALSDDMFIMIALYDQGDSVGLDLGGGRMHE